MGRLNIRDSTDGFKNEVASSGVKGCPTSVAGGERTRGILSPLILLINDGVVIYGRIYR